MPSDWQEISTLLEKMLATQTPVEPEFYPALYENRAEMYALLTDPPTEQTEAG